MAKIYLPTADEMVNFSNYIKHLIDHKSNEDGIAVIRPPPSYKARAESYPNIVIYENAPPEAKGPFVQMVEGRSGKYLTYNTQLEQRNEPMTVSDFANLVNLKPMSKDPEREFWMGIKEKPHPVYANDSPGSLFDETQTSFNLNNLNTFFDAVCRTNQYEWAGVNSPYVYYGHWRSHFPAHTEDMDLYSINYLHYGAIKTWYAIPPDHSDQFEELCKSIWPAKFEECEAFTRHKSILISPDILKNAKVPYVKVDQLAGDFVVTFPRSYHEGFNQGFNCSEAVNFALEDWIPIGKSAKICKCGTHQVFNFDMEPFETASQQVPGDEEFDRIMDDCKKQWPREFDQSQTIIKEIVEYIRSRYAYQVKQEEKRKQTQFHHFIKKSDLYSDVITNCATAESGRGMASKANIGKIVKKIFPLVEADAKFNDSCVYKHLKIKN